MGAKLRVLAVAGALLAMSLAGCGGDKSNGGDKGGAGGSPARGQIEEGGVLRIGTTTELDSLNPYVQVSFESSVVSRAAYPSLVRYDADTKVQPSLAASWEPSSDNRVWTFKLKPAKWSDGKPLTSEDVRWTIDAQLKYATDALAGTAFVVGGMEKVEAPDPSTVVITYEKPLGPIYDLLSRIQILPKHVWGPHEGSDGKGLAEFDPSADLPMVAGGPYIPTRFERRGTAVLEKNPDYFGDDKPHADTIAIRVFTNPESLSQALLAGELDYVNSLPPQTTDTVKAKGGFTVEAVPGVETPVLGINSNEKKVKRPELLDAEVRKAFEHAIDRQEIADVAYAGFAKPAAAYLAAYSPWSNPALEPLPFDVAEANRILDAAGFATGSDGMRSTPDGDKMEYEVLANRDLSGVNRVLEILENGFQKIGVKLKARLLDAAALDKRTIYPTLDFDMILWSTFTAPDPEYLTSTGTCEAAFGAGYCSKDYDALHDQESTTVDEDARREIVFKMQERYFEARAFIQMVTLSLVTARKSDWEGFVPTLLGRSNTFLTSPHKVG